MKSLVISKKTLLEGGKCTLMFLLYVLLYLQLLIGVLFDCRVVAAYWVIGWVIMLQVSSHTVFFVHSPSWQG